MAVSARLLCSFLHPTAHQEVSRIIRECSTNPDDIRDVALQGVDLGAVRNVVDLGCGFGFMTEKVAPRLPARAVVLGVDACETNRACFLERLAAAHCAGDFIAMHLEDKLPWADRSFDLALCSYSLYFFPGILPEIARVLRPDGILVSTTHGVDSLRTLFPVTGIPEAGALLPALFRRFPAEQAQALLEPHFREVQRTDYPNSLRFGPAQVADLLLYVQFKLPLLIPGADLQQEVPQTVRQAIDDYFARYGEVVLEKNDACFVCRRPRWP